MTGLEDLLVEDPLLDAACVSAEGLAGETVHGGGVGEELVEAVDRVGGGGCDWTGVWRKQRSYIGGCTG